MGRWHLRRAQRPALGTCPGCPRDMCCSVRVTIMVSRGIPIDRSVRVAYAAPAVSDPRVSFVVPTYNYAGYVGRAVDSLLAQTFPAIEVIVIDDASTDATSEVLHRYADEPRVRVYRHDRNQGHIQTYNEGLLLARGEFVGLLSADDLCLRTDAVARQVALFDADPDVGFVYSPLAFIDEHDRLTQVWGPHAQDGIEDGLDVFRRLVFGNYVPASGPLVRASAHQAIGYYDVRLPHAGDWDLWLRLAARYRVGYVADAVYGYRRHALNMHHQVVTPKVADDDHVLVLTRAFAAVGGSMQPDIRRLRRQAFRVAAHRAVDLECQRGHRARGWRRAASALRRFPELAVASAFYASLAKLTMVTLVGQERARGLVALGRPHRLGQAWLRAVSGSKGR